MPDDLGLDLDLETTAPDATGASLPPDQPQVTPPEAPAPESFSSSSLYQRAQQAGLPLDGIESPDQFQEFLLDQLVQAKPYAEYGRSALANPTQYLPQDNSGQSPQDDGQSAAEEFDEDSYFSQAWTVPQLSQGAKWALDHGAFEVGDNGMIMPSKEPHLQAVAMQYLKEINDYQQARQVQNEAFQANPVKFMAEKLLPYFEHKFNPKFNTIAQQHLQEYQTQTFEEKFTSDNKAWLYGKDGITLSAEGLKFRDTVLELKRRGITDPETLADWGMKLAGINTHAGTQAVQQDVAPVAPAPSKGDQPRDEQGKFTKAKDGPPQAEPKSKQESFLDQVKRRAAGGSNQGSHNAEDFIVSNEGELDTMFTSAWREYAGAK